MMKALKEMKKQGGMYLCEPCLKKQIAKSTPNVDKAFKDSLDSGLYKESEPNKKCFVCDADAKYKVQVGDAMAGIRKHVKI